MRPFEAVLDLGGHPEHTLYRLMLACLEPGEPPHPHPAVTTPDGETADVWDQFCTGLRQAGWVEARAGKAMMIDRMIARSEATIDAPTDTSRQIRWQLPQMDHSILGYVVRRDEEWRLAALAGETALVGREALMQLKRGTKADAMQWMEWLGREQIVGGPDAPALTYAALRTGLDAKAVAPKSRDLLLAATAAAAHPQAANVWQRHGPKAARSAPKLTGILLTHALVQMARAEQLETMELLGQSDWGAPIISEELRTYVARQSMHRHTPSAALDTLPAPADRTPLDWQAAAELQVRLGDHAAATRAFEAAASIEESPNNRAWSMLLAGHPPKAVATLLSDHFAQHGSPGAAELHTLATALANDEQPDAAGHVLRTLIEQDAIHTADHLPPHWWYVLGRMAQSYGLHDTARAYYARVPDTASFQDVRTFCDRELERMTAPPTSRQGR